MTPTRRRVLGWAGVGLGLATGGCSGDDSSLGLHAVSAQLIHRRGDDRFDYPEDVAVRVAVENTAPERREGTLRTTLEYVEGGEDGETPRVADSWTETRDVSLAGGTTRGYLSVFENVFDGGDGSPFRASASI